MLTEVADDVDDWPIQRLQTVATAGQQPEQVISSVFDLATVPFKLRSAAQARDRHAHYRIEHLEGVTRCTRLQEQDTDEWKERELQRRARQILPKPPRSARSFSKKFAALVGIAR